MWCVSNGRLNDIWFQDEDDDGVVLDPIPDLDQETDFMPAESFDGSREGYAFKMGQFGLGEQTITAPVNSHARMGWWCNA